MGDNNENSIFDTEKTWLQRDFGLDRRLIKALAKLGYTYPTLVQSKCIPIALQGKDVLVRARTGSGKTVAFALPVLQKVLQLKEADSANTGVKCIILAPTKELIKQIDKNMTDLIYYCRDIISLCSLVDDNQRVIDYRLQSKPDIILTTPAKLSQQLKKGGLDVSQAGTLVIDEADLVLSYGYKQDVHAILSHMPKIFQGIFMSATLSTELEKFKRLVLHNPAILKLEESKSAGNLLQFYLNVTEADKYLVLYVFIKLGLLQGKGLIFVNDVNKCYRLKLFLQQFFISSAVLNAEVPLNSRTHILEEFNRGVFDYLIATDATVDHGDDDDDEDEEDDGENSSKQQEESESVEDEEGAEPEIYNSEDDEDLQEEDDEDDENGSEEGDEEDEEDGEEEVDDNENDNADQDEGSEVNDEELSAAKSNKKEKKNSKQHLEKDEYGVSRGIDFTGVNFVVNFDFPQTTAAYTHRIGRTARGMNTGTSLSFVTKYDAAKSDSKEAVVAQRDWEVLQDVRMKQPRLGVVEGDNILAAIGATDGVEQNDEMRMQPAPLVFNMQELESFRYRVADTLRAVTGAAVRELRAAEIKREILNSEKLKSYFAENPNDLKVLRHDKAILHPIKQKDHLKFVPDYLIPANMRSVANVNTKKKKRKNDHQSQESRMKKSKQNDPLYGGGNNNNESNNSNNEKELTTYGKSQSGRNQWKERHKKGEFNPKVKKMNKNITPGSFMQSKRKFRK